MEAKLLIEEVKLLLMEVMEAKLLKWRRWKHWNRGNGQWRRKIVDNGGDGSEIVRGGEIIIDGDDGGNYWIEAKLLLE